MGLLETYARKQNKERIESGLESALLPDLDNSFSNTNEENELNNESNELPNNSLNGQYSKADQDILKPDNTENTNSLLDNNFDINIEELEKNTSLSNNSIEEINKAKEELGKIKINNDSDKFENYDDYLKIVGIKYSGRYKDQDREGGVLGIASNILKATEGINISKKRNKIIDFFKTEDIIENTKIIDNNNGEERSPNWEEAAKIKKAVQEITLFSKNNIRAELYKEAENKKQNSFGTIKEVLNGDQFTNQEKQRLGNAIMEHIERGDKYVNDVVELVGKAYDRGILDESSARSKINEIIGGRNEYNKRFANIGKIKMEWEIEKEANPGIESMEERIRNKLGYDNLNDYLSGAYSGENKTFGTAFDNLIYEADQLSNLINQNKVIKGKGFLERLDGVFGTALSGINIGTGFITRGTRELLENVDVLDDLLGNYNVLGSYGVADATELKKLYSGEDSISKEIGIKFANFFDEDVFEFLDIATLVSGGVSLVGKGAKGIKAASFGLSHIDDISKLSKTGKVIYKIADGLEGVSKFVKAIDNPIGEFYDYKKGISKLFTGGIDDISGPNKITKWKSLLENTLTNFVDITTDGTITNLKSLRYNDDRDELGEVAKQEGLGVLLGLGIGAGVHLAKMLPGGSVDDIFKNGDSLGKTSLSVLEIQNKINDVIFEKASELRKEKGGVLKMTDLMKHFDDPVIKNAVGEGRYISFGEAIATKKLFNFAIPTLNAIVQENKSLLDSKVLRNKFNETLSEFVEKTNFSQDINKFKNKNISNQITSIFNTKIDGINNILENSSIVKTKREYDSKLDDSVKTIFEGTNSYRLYNNEKLLNDGIFGNISINGYTEDDIKIISNNIKEKFNKNLISKEPILEVFSSIKDSNFFNKSLNGKYYLSNQGMDKLGIKSDLKSRIFSSIDIKEMAENTKKYLAENITENNKKTLDIINKMIDDNTFGDAVMMIKRKLC